MNFKRPLHLLITVKQKDKRWTWSLAEDGSRPVKTGTAATEDDAFGDAQQARWIMVDETART